ncbi:hypothetical protein Y032_0823g2542 [Ancylostoma ceylanicum]|nr:hypothetical protein Y032_0823g2542 [Ancylostoma ceylanicum]
MEMRAVRSLIFIEFVATAIAQDFTDPPPEPSNLKTNVDSVSDLFPYTIPGEVELLNLETGSHNVLSRKNKSVEVGIDRYHDYYLDR